MPVTARLCSFAAAPDRGPKRGRGQRPRLQLITRHSSPITLFVTAGLAEDVALGAASESLWV
jgi:hypothetical protein